MFEDINARILKASSLYEGDLHFENARQIRKDDFLEVHYRTNLELGDVLVTNAGTIGRVAVARDSEKVSRTTFQKSVAVLKPVRGMVLPEYLAMYVENIVARLQKKSSGTAVKNLLLRDLRAIAIALPSLQEQEEIVRRVEALLKIADTVEDHYRKAQEQLDNLPQAILAKAFRGELGPQDPNDEPAGALLDRVRDERLAADGRPQGRRGAGAKRRSTRAGADPELS